MQVIILKYPVSFEGREIKELTIRRAKVKDMVAVSSLGDGNVLKTTALLISKLASIPIEAVDEIDAADFEVIKKLLDGFLSASPEAS